MVSIPTLARRAIFPIVSDSIAISLHAKVYFNVCTLLQSQDPKANIILARAA
jgi:hypothetical protein